MREIVHKAIPLSGSVKVKEFTVSGNNPNAGQSTYSVSIDTGIKGLVVNKNVFLGNFSYEGYGIANTGWSTVDASISVSGTNVIVTVTNNRIVASINAKIYVVTSE